MAVSGFPAINAIFLAEFHPDQGPIVTLSIPEDAVESKIDFNAIQTLVIPKLTLFERLITVNTGVHKVMCYPIAVEGNYQRNVLIFNMCFAFDIDADTKCYESVVKRVGCLLKELEIKGRLMSNPEGKRPLRAMMNQLVNKLNDHGEYQIDLDLQGFISIKLFPLYDNPSEIAPYHVPVKTIDVDSADDILWDLVLDKVLQRMDNVNHVRRIAKLTRISEATVIAALKHLDYYGCIGLVDIFQFGNVYETQHRVLEFYRDAWLQKECFNYVTREGAAGDIGMLELIQLYSTMRERQTVAEWIVGNQVDIERFDVRRFIIFGVMHRILRRVHCYPVLDEPETRHTDEADGAEEADGELTSQIKSLLDGTHHLDEISVVTDKDISTLRGMFDRHGGVEYVYL
ncbi:nitrogen permease regulator 2 [Martensiomyces pterosporus]|nr:nitrogen permease regulator 2 [Martensiomyces pterosporus]